MKVIHSLPLPMRSAGFLLPALAALTLASCAAPPSPPPSPPPIAAAPPPAPPPQAPAPAPTPPPPLAAPASPMAKAIFEANRKGSANFVPPEKMGSRSQAKSPQPVITYLNPVDIVKEAGATPEAGASKGEVSTDGSWWTASGTFSELKYRNGRFAPPTIIVVFTFKSMKEMRNSTATKETTDSRKVLIGKNRPFFADLAVTDTQDGIDFDVDPFLVAERIGATVKP